MENENLSVENIYEDENECEKNLLEDLEYLLKRHGKSLDDILFIKTEDGCLEDLETIKSVLNIQYSRSWDPYIEDAPEMLYIRDDLKIVGDDFWVDVEYESATDYPWWETQELAFRQKPVKTKVLNTLEIR